MPTIGTDCQLILDGTGYWIEPATYKVARARIRRADETGVAASPVGPGAGAGEIYVDRGPGKREWTFIVVAFNGMHDYANNALPATGQQIHDALQTSYNKVNTQLAFVDPTGTSWNVWFDDLVEELSDVRSQVDGCQWYLSVTLVEA
jgi:hypothetical protein